MIYYFTSTPLPVYELILTLINCAFLGFDLVPCRLQIPTVSVLGMLCLDRQEVLCFQFERKMCSACGSVGGPRNYSRTDV